MLQDIHVYDDYNYGHLGRDTCGKYEMSTISKEAILGPEHMMLLLIMLMV